MNPENVCKNLKPAELKKLSDNDSLKIIYDLQYKLQERLGEIDRYKKADMREKCICAMEHIFHMNAEMVEFMERLPFKRWKQYTPEQLKDWISDEQRTETVFEAIDFLHFALNIFIIFNITPEEIVNYYLQKNKENHNRQENNY